MDKEERIKAIRTTTCTTDQNNLIKKQDLSGADLSHLNLSHLDLSETNFFKANLSNSNLSGANFDKADLTGADLSNANLTEASFKRSGLGHANLSNSTLFNANLSESTLSNADLSEADLRAANLLNCRAPEALFINTDCTESNFQGANLSSAKVHGATFINSNLDNVQLLNLSGYEKANWTGVDIRDINFSGAYQVRRFIIDQNYLKEFRERNKLNHFLYYLWLITSDCGRSISRWGLIIFLQIVFFAIIYKYVDIDFGPYQTTFSPFYHSVATMTTLGYGDVIPKTICAQITVVCQVISGYIMLGGLLSILTNKLARRAD